MKDTKTEIFRYGKELFAEKGFKDTNVADITAKAGIGVGTFYNYYPSKEKLFLEIYLAENAKLKTRLMNAFDPDDDPMEAMAKMTVMNIEGMHADPILRQWYNRDVFGRIEALYREENGIDAVDFMFDFFIKIIRRWQADGKVRGDIEPEYIVAMFSAIINIDTHKEEIGLKYFQKVQEYIGEFVMRGLMDVPQ